MQGDLLKGIKGFMQSFQEFKDTKITQKSLSDGYLFMQLLSIVNANHFNLEELSKPIAYSQREEYSGLFKDKKWVLQKSIKIECYLRKSQHQLELSMKIRNWRTFLKRVREYLSVEYEKGIRYGDIDIVGIVRSYQMEEIGKMFELVLCVIANCKQKDEFISRMMQLQPQTQQTLAGLMKGALQSRVCSLQSQEKSDLLQELRSKEQQLQSLYQEINKLSEVNKQLQSQVDDKQKIEEMRNYERQKILTLSKKSSLQLNSSSIIDKSLQDQSLLTLQNGRENILQTSIQDQLFISPHSLSKNTLIESLKNKLIREQQSHQQQVQQLSQKIFQLQERLKECEYFEELLVVYQDKYQEALTYVEKVNRYEKDKSKLNQEIMQKDFIIDQLKTSIEQLNQDIVALEEDKIDLELLIAKMNTQKLITSRKINKSINQPQQIINLSHSPQTSILQLEKQPLTSQQQHNLSFSCNNQPSQQMNKISLNMNSCLEEQQQDSKVEQLQQQIDSLTLEVKRLQRKEKQLTRQNNSFKGKLSHLRKVQNQNKLHSRRNEETQILTSCLYQTYNDFNFNTLIGTNTLVSEKSQNSNANIQ